MIAKATPTLVSISNPNTNVLPGGIVVDTATVTKAPGAIAPTGSVRFILCRPDEVTANGCPAGSGTKVGPDRSLVNGSAITLLHLGAATPGKHCWRARYLGDANYSARNHTNATTECFTVQ